MALGAFGALGGTVLAATCPFGSASADGCAGAPVAGSFARPSPFAAYAQQSGQTWVNTHPWNWNAPGVDYAVGYSTTAPLLDPATAPLPTGCAYSPTGSASGGSIVLCGVSKNQPALNPTIQNIDFSLHGCTVLQFTVQVSGTITVANNNFKNGPNCAVTGGWLVGVAGGSSNFVFENNVVDGDWPNETAVMGDDVKDISNGNATFEYNSFINSPQRPINVGGPGDVTVKYNYFEGWVLNTQGAEHGEILEEGSISNKTIKSVVYAYNTTLIPATAPQLGPGPISLVGASGGASKFSAVTVENNVEIANLSGGPGGASAISAAMADWIWGIYGTITLQNNYVDPTGAHYCVGDLGGSAGVTGSVSTNTLTVTSINQGAIYPNATFSATGLTPAKVAAYGTVDPATGSASTGAGGVGTYVLAGPAQNATFTGGVTSSPVAKLVEGGNISLVTGSPITGINGRAGSATCPPLF